MMSCQQVDTALLLFWQSLLDSDFADTWIPYLRNKNTWYPIYLGLISWMVFRFKSESWKYILSAAVVVALSDVLSSHILKEWFARPRPCQVQELMPQLKMLVHCSPHFSMPSSHAANHFALSAYLVFSKVSPGPLWHGIAWAWATVIGLAQVYVGVHYPGDIAVGAIIGIVLATWVVYVRQRLEI
jgi:membrane-associated phospholipid phosphatase